MIQLTKSESLKIMAGWQEYGEVLNGVFDKLISEYESDFKQQATEWEAARQQVEYIAKKQALLDLKKILTKRYD